MSNNRKTLKNAPNKYESIFGAFYIVAEQLPVPLLLALVFKLFKLPLSNLWMNFAFFAVNFVVVAAVFHKFLAASLRQLGRRFGHVLGNCVAGFLLYWASNVFVSLIITLCFPSFANANDAYIQTLANDDFWVIFVGSVLLVPLAEETLFRGVLFGSLDKWNRPMAYILSALLFGAIHIVGYLLDGSYTLVEAAISMLQYLPAGLCLAWVYAETDTIFAPILVHTANNLIAVMAMR